jgi:hypothetical protein
VTEGIETQQLPSAATPPVDSGPPAEGGSSLKERATTIANDRPEVAAGAAFAGGLLFALILKRIAR